MSSALLLYLLYSGLAVALCVWTALLAAQPIEEHKPMHRGLTLLPALLLPPAVGIATLAWPFGRPELLLALLAVPPLALAAEVSAGMTLSGQNILVRLLHVPVAAWNATLVVIYLLRAGLELGGTDVSTEMAALVNAHAHLQRNVGQVDALAAPFWFHIPLMMPLWLRYGVAHILALLVSSTVAVAMLGLLALQMPWGFDQAEGFRDGGTDIVSLRSDLEVGVSIPVLSTPPAAWAPTRMSRGAWDAQQLALQELDPQIVSVEIGPDTLEDVSAMERLLELREAAHGDGRKFIVTARPPERFDRRPADDLERLASAMGDVHRAAAARLRPDLLVLYAEPYGRLADCIASPATIDDWVERVRKDSIVPKRAVPGLRVAVTLSSRAAHAEELFLRLSKPSSPVDAVGLMLRPDRMTMGDVQAALKTWKGWAALHPKGKEIWVLDTGAVPAVVGGELGQWRFLREVLMFAHDTARVRGVAFESIVDRKRASGLLAAFGRHRMAFTWLDRSLDERSPADAESPPESRPPK